ncbi:MarR family winged helix-turn-helix transcriptional regulator [Tessaracoccus palaemonis]|uniref:MarR family transcriptional regulator n=1 Tax=Tessaracoccus palaemonis TaxID=2829499 RepID=A0ABX8SJE2_9ACTN|nr:MarR family transcriptional regulator [Tessaracoccus palaemonis]QXT63476.1 MarR family transcriptional regulator [Tessaracoccus palaemonis]
MPRPSPSVLVPASDVDASPVLKATREPLLDLFERLIRVANSDVARRELMNTVGFPGADVPTFLAVNQLALHGALRPTDLAERLETGRPNLTKIVQRLESLGLAARVADPSDERGVLVALTDEGRRIAKRVIRTEREWVTATLVGWEDEEVSTFTQLLAKFVDRLDSASRER